jgi:cytochrome c oxidase cbb3-type subunit I
MTVVYWMAAFYLLLAVLSLLDQILLQFGLAPGLTNLYWLRLHLLTIGVLAQAVLGTLPSLLTTRLNLKRPPPTALWTIFGLFNVGLMLLAVGQVLGVVWQIYSGATLLLLAVLVEIGLLGQMWRRAPRPRAVVAGFYLAAPLFLLLGVLMALTMLMNWWAPVNYLGVKEAHVHANIFGFTGIVVAGVILDRLPPLFGRKLARPTWVAPTLWLMVIGGVGLWLGPYVGSLAITGASLVVYVAGTGLMLANFFITTHRPRSVRIVNGAHVFLSYIWIAAPAVATVFYVTLGPERVPLARLEFGITQGLIYGWILQLALALLPLMITRLPSERPERVIRRSEGSWFSLVVLNAAVAVIWLSSLLLPWPLAGPVVGIAYLFVIGAILPYLRTLVRALLQVPKMAELAGGIAERTTV